jgi:protein-tyrosine phosphatase
MKQFPINCRPVGGLHDNVINDMKSSLMLYRSASLDKTEQAFPCLVDELALECQIDLRNLHEIDNSLTRKNSFIHKQIFSMEDPQELIRNSSQFNYKVYGKSYINLITSNVDTIINLIRYLITSPYERFIISCYAGKDRTGIISAIILLLFDMPEWLIYIDYSMSTSYLLQNLSAFESNWRKRNISAETYAERFKVDPRGLQYMLQYFTTHEKGLINYLKKHDLSENDISQFNTKYERHKRMLLPL